MIAVPPVFATKVPRGKSLRCGVKNIARAYRVSVPGNENRMAAVAWCRKDGDNVKYNGMVAT